MRREQPELWDTLSPRIKQAVYERVKSQLPGIVRGSIPQVPLRVPEMAAWQVHGAGSSARLRASERQTRREAGTQDHGPPQGGSRLPKGGRVRRISLFLVLGLAQTLFLAGTDWAQEMSFSDDFTFFDTARWSEGDHVLGRSYLDPANVSVNGRNDW